MIEANHPTLSVTKQCELLGLARSTRYYESQRDDEHNEFLMRLLDEQYTRTPFYGVLRMTHWLREQDHEVNEKRVRRLLRKMGLEAVYPKPRLSAPGAGHLVYPYLLRGLAVDTPNQVWATDITYIRMRRGFAFLIAILDWRSRYVVSWKLSPSLETAFCLEALETALETTRPEIFNSDQGAQFTSRDFTSRLEVAGVRISMDGRGRFYDNIFVERLWRTVKYEEVYLKEYEDVDHAREGLGRYFRFYNGERFHQSLDYATPASVYFGTKKKH